MTFNALQTWLPHSTQNALIISGPCGAESLEQLLQTASELKTLQKVSLFRAGVWKPRTRPNSFEGKGEIALRWLAEVKRQTGFKVTVEVANAQHVELALKYGTPALSKGL